MSHLHYIRVERSPAPQHACNRTCVDQCTNHTLFHSVDTLKLLPGSEVSKVPSFLNIVSTFIEEAGPIEVVWSNLHSPPLVASISVQLGRLVLTCSRLVTVLCALQLALQAELELLRPATGVSSTWRRESEELCEAEANRWTSLQAAGVSAPLDGVISRDGSEYQRRQWWKHEKGSVTRARQHQ